MTSSVTVPPTSQLRAALRHQFAPHNHATHITTHCRQQLTRSVEPPRLRGLSVAPDPPADTRLLPSSDGVTSLFRPLWFAVSLANSLHAMPKPSAGSHAVTSLKFRLSTLRWPAFSDSRLASKVCSAKHALLVYSRSSSASARTGLHDAETGIGPHAPAGCRAANPCAQSQAPPRQSSAHPTAMLSACTQHEQCHATVATA